MISSNEGADTVAALRDALSLFDADVEATQNSTEPGEALVDATNALLDRFVSALTSGTITNMTGVDLGTAVDEIIRNDLFFTRAAVQQGWVDVIEGFFDALGLSEQPLNATQLMDVVLEIADNVTTGVDGNRTDGVPNSILVIPVVVLDEALQDVRKDRRIPKRFVCPWCTLRFAFSFNDLHDAYDSVPHRCVLAFHLCLFLWYEFDSPLVCVCFLPGYPNQCPRLVLVG